VNHLFVISQLPRTKDNHAKENATQKIMPPKDEVPVVADENDDQYATKNDDIGCVIDSFDCVACCQFACTDSNDYRNQKSRGKTSNPNQNVGGTAYVLRIR
jgi:hypothetical protein